MPSYAQKTFTDLKTHLATIRENNGYRTTIRAVHTGRTPTIALSGADLPVIVLTPISDTPDREPLATVAVAQEWIRRIVLEVVFATDGAWDESADALLEDVRRALAGFPVSLELAGPVEILPEIERSDLGLIRMPLRYSHLVVVPQNAPS